jgi:signal transduction histidine kinase
MRSLFGGVSLRFRLTILVMSVFLMFQLVMGIGYWFISREIDNGALDRKLRERVTGIAREPLITDAVVTPEELARIRNQELATLEFEDIELDVLDRDGRSLAYEETRWPRIADRIVRHFSRTDAPFRARIPAAEGGISDIGTRMAEVSAAMVLSSLPQRRYVVMVASDAFVSRRSRMTTQSLTIGGLFGLLASAISGWVISGFAVRPLDRITRLAGSLTPENLGVSIHDDALNPEIARLSEQLEHSRQRLHNAFAAQERFLSNISHELKTPIATLLLEAQTMQRDGLPEHAADFVDVAEEEMRKLGRLIESFLVLTRVEDGGATGALRPYPANELLLDAIADCSPQAEQYGVRLVPTLADDDAGIDATVRGDPELLRTLLNNLLRNAIRFSPRNGRVHVTAQVRGKAFHVEVLDEGPGLPPEIIDHIFDRFVQSSDEVRRGRGHGLGLAIAKGIAELHGGTVVAQNHSSGGAAFLVDLPLASHAEDRPAPDLREPHPSEG